MIKKRPAKSIYQTSGNIKNGTFNGRWHFSFDEYYNPTYTSFGHLRVFNDDTLSNGAIWPLHPHKNVEIITYCVSGEFRHEDENGTGGILKKGWVQHTSVGSGMFHSEINDLADTPLRFVQMWFEPNKQNLTPSVAQMEVIREERTNILLPIVSNHSNKSLPIHSDISVYSSFLTKGSMLHHDLNPERGYYCYILEGGPISVNSRNFEVLSAGVIQEEKEITIEAHTDTELLLVDIGKIS